MSASTYIKSCVYLLETKGILLKDKQDKAVNMQLVTVYTYIHSFLCLQYCTRRSFLIWLGIYGSVVLFFPVRCPYFFSHECPRHLKGCLLPCVATRTRSWNDSCQWELAECAFVVSDSRSRSTAVCQLWQGNHPRFGCSVYDRGIVFPWKTPRSWNSPLFLPQSFQDFPLKQEGCSPCRDCGAQGSRALSGTLDSCLEESKCQRNAPVEEESEIACQSCKQCQEIQT